jgi:hypothetical protein
LPAFVSGHLPGDVDVLETGPDLDPTDSAVRDLTEWLAFESDVRHLEQEALEPAMTSLAVGLPSSGGWLQG